jgi:hypothetical protein
MIDILLIALITVYALDVSGFYAEITTIISGWLTNGMIRKPIMIKPFCCSKCMTFWLSVGYLLLHNQFTIPMVAYCCLISYMTTVFSDLMFFVLDFVKSLMANINNKLN